ncbi:MAG: DUF485 domain-containing protein [Actinobacteria bacterium]|jgi:uncharacterized membrane protein (DUF485 family)|nr:DUF485 domain-containing protein [Actinomycetota bacterium]
MERGEEWRRVSRTSAFGELMRAKKAFIIPAVIFFLVFYMAMPVLAEFTTVLDGQAIGALNWAYVYGFAQFLMTWILMHIYVSRAKKWDKLVDEAREEASEERTMH